MSHSWERLNIAMRSALDLAIEYGLRFDRDDFGAMDKWRPGYWRDIEGSYAVASGCERGRGNMSACLAIEKHLDRKPFLVCHRPDEKTPNRVYVRCQFHWYGTLVTCTSFDDERGSFVACTYKKRGTDERDYPTGRKKIARRYTITHQDVRDYHAAIKEWSALNIAIAAADDDAKLQLRKWTMERFPKECRLHYGFSLKQLEKISDKLAKLVAEKNS